MSANPYPAGVAAHAHWCMLMAHRRLARLEAELRAAKPAVPEGAEERVWAKVKAEIEREAVAGDAA